MNTRFKAIHRRLLTLIAAAAMTVVLVAGLLIAMTAPVLSQETETTPDGGYLYTVQEGDNWDTVAIKTGVDVETLQTANPDAVRDTGWLLSGEKLAIPPVGDSASQIHVVEAGESWSTIAKDYGVSVTLLYAANPGSVRAGMILYKGEKIVIPSAGAVATAEAATEEPAAEATPEETPEAPSEAAAEATPEATDEAANEADATQAMTETAAAEEPTATPEPAAPITVPLTVPVGAGEPMTATQPVTGTEPTTDTEAMTEPVAAAATCPQAFADYPDAMLAVLNADGGDADALAAFLDACDAAVEDGIVSLDLSGDGAETLVVVYRNSSQQSAFIEGDLLILAPGDDGYTVAYRARAAGEVRLLAAEDINADDQIDVAWVDTTCGASTCFDTVNVRSWDGELWADWTEGTITMAYADIVLVDAPADATFPTADAAAATDAGDTAGTAEAVPGLIQGAQIKLSGGIYGSVGAGPQRSRTEVWSSVDGAPYQLTEKTYADSECLYHTVIDANRALLDAPISGFEAATALYERAVTDESLIKCWVRADEVEELRSFSLFRLALIAADQGDAEGTQNRIAELSATYPGSIYDDVGQVWSQAFDAEGDAAAACEAVTAHAEENPAAWEILADYGYTNPSFEAADVCPVLDLAAPDAEGDSTNTGATETLPQSDLGADLGANGNEDAVSAAPECPADLAGYAEALPAVLEEALTAANYSEQTVADWMRVCGVLADDRGAIVVADLNGDGTDDVVVFPTLISDVGLGPKGAQGAVLVYHSQPDGSITLAFSPETYGKPMPLGTGDLNDDGLTDLAWTVEGCAASCVLETQIWSWDGEEYVSMIAPGAVIALGTAMLEPVAGDDPGSGQSLVLEGGVSDTLEGGLAVPHREIWQSVDGEPYRRISWTYDRTAEGNDCMGLRLVEADVALTAADVIGYQPAVDLYAATLDDGTAGMQHLRPAPRRRAGPAARPGALPPDAGADVRRRLRRRYNDTHSAGGRPTRQPLPRGRHDLVGFRERGRQCGGCLRRRRADLRRQPGPMADHRIISATTTRPSPPNRSASYHEARGLAGVAQRSLVMTGVPAAIASSAIMPKPSYKLGKTKAVAKA